LNEQLTLMSVMKLKQTKISDFFNKQRTNWTPFFPDNFYSIVCVLL
jgi:hypothetical protein